MAGASAVRAALPAALLGVPFTRSTRRNTHGAGASSSRVGASARARSSVCCSDKRFELVDKEKYFKSKQAASTVYLQAAGGMRYCDLKMGDGKLAQKGILVCFHYEGKRLNGKVMESSWTTATTPPCVKAGHTPEFPALGEGVVGMREGGKRELIIPPSMNRPGVEEVMIYTLELVTVAPAGEEPADAPPPVTEPEPTRATWFWQRLVGGPGR
ncbi:unnamed protein product [Durusdinium trenchii]|uniref:peptidylprolyl isomerase n=1 Tax=Durusdinium trenchii TaxID=1381693 RepID=A0ABP0HPM2_9DINO